MKYRRELVEMPALFVVPNDSLGEVCQPGLRRNLSRRLINGNHFVASPLVGAFCESHVFGGPWAVRTLHSGTLLRLADIEHVLTDMRVWINAHSATRSVVPIHPSSGPLVP